MPLAKGLTFSHIQGGDTATWELHLHGSELHVKADCPANRWCSLGFNKDKPKMDGIDVFTFGHHPGVDLSDCHKLRSNKASPTTPSPFLPYERELKVWLPAPPTLRAVGAPQSPKALGGVVGIALNSVLFVHEHPGEGMTWVIDNCGGHGDTFGHYHYHAPPICLLRSLGVPVPEAAWWKAGGAEQWASHGPEVQIGWALDGAPIMAPFKAGVQVKKEMLDECHGAVDNVTGEYKYYTVLAPPFMPPCLRGKVLGEVKGYRSSKGGVPCEQSHMAPAPAAVVPAVPVVPAAARSHAIAVLAEHAAPQPAELVERAAPPLAALVERAAPPLAALVEHVAPPLVEHVVPALAELVEHAVPPLAAHVALQHVVLAEHASPQALAEHAVQHAVLHAALLAALPAVVLAVAAVAVARTNVLARCSAP
ncbi:unnamed protein product [Symbiodinium sp. CCMP2456]|nr:unnamed protein product [Symbiodinium sp. CCMP2456]